MEIKKSVILKVEINSKVYTFNCDEDAPLGAIWDALQQMKRAIFEQMKAQHELEIPKEPEVKAELEEKEEACQEKDSE